MTGARVIKSLSGGDRVFMTFNAGGTFAAGDFVKFDDSGEIVVATAGAGILGVAMEAGVDGTDGVSVDVTSDMVVLMDNDNAADTFVSTDVGLCGDFTGGTGAMVMDTSSLSSTVAGLRCIAYNPQGYGSDSDTSVGLFYVCERELAEREL